jgi:DNA-binding LacI/PurR family transcriptional regulator
VATRADVAKLAGVSTSTVSYALSGARPITEETRRRILSAMEELGYIPNALASGLAGRRSRILALLFPAGPRRVGSADLEYVVAAADAARECGYHVVLWPTSDGDLAEVRRLSKSGLVDGVLLMEVVMEDERVGLFQSAGIPVALIGRTRQPADLIFADADFDQMARLAVKHLADLGHRHIGLLSASQQMLDLGYGPSARTADAIVQATTDRGLDLAALACDHTVDAGRAALSELITRSPRLTAVISAFNWEGVIGLIEEADQRRLRIPQRLSVLLMTSSEGQAELTRPTLTTIGPSSTEIGRAAALALVDRLEKPDAPPGQRLFAGALVQRGSTGPAHSRASR